MGTIYTRKGGFHVTPTGCSHVATAEVFLFQPFDDSLSHVVLLGKLQVHNATANAIREAGTLKTHTELRVCLGVCDAYRLLVFGLAKSSGPLKEMLKKQIPSEFEDLTDEQYEAYQSLKNHW